MQEPICQSFMRISFFWLFLQEQVQDSQDTFASKTLFFVFLSSYWSQNSDVPLEAGGPHTDSDLVPPGWGAEFCDSLLNPWSSVRLLTRSVLSSLLPPVPECISPLYWVPSQSQLLLHRGTEACRLEPGAPTPMSLCSVISFIIRGKWRKGLTTHHLF